MKVARVLRNAHDLRLQWGGDAQCCITSSGVAVRTAIPTFALVLFTEKAAASRPLISGTYLLHSRT